MKLICGPMATIGHPAFRILLEKFGYCDEYFTEMINAGSLLSKGGFEKFYINPAPNPDKVVWQLTGKNAEKMAESAAMLSELPGIGIDLNMGCSAPDVYKYGAGIAWMLKPIEETRDMVRRVRAAVPSSKRLSVKFRLGDDNFTDKGFFSFCKMLVDEGVELLTLHPRTKKEKLVRPPRYSYCQKLAEIYSDYSESESLSLDDGTQSQGGGVHGIPVIVNGNIKDVPSAEFAIKSVPAAKGIMISRAAVQKPWIFYELARELKLSSEIPQSITIDMRQIALDYINDVEIYQPPEFWKTRLQRFFFYFTANFKFAHYAQTQFLNAQNNEDLRCRINEFFQKCPEEQQKEI